MSVRRKVKDQRLRILVDSNRQMPMRGSSLHEKINTKGLVERGLRWDGRRGP